jgi:hypothetical protein
LPEKPVKPLLQDSLPPAPAFKSIKEYDENEKKHRNRTRKAKKAKKDSVLLKLVLKHLVVISLFLLILLITWHRVDIIT